MRSERLTIPAVSFGRLAACLSALLVIAGVGGVCNARGRAKPVFVLLVADGVCWQDISGALAPNLHRLINDGAVGLMSGRVAGRNVSEAAYLSLGTGSRAVAEQSGAQIGWCGAADDAAIEALAGRFTSRAGVHLGPLQVGCWAIVAMARENAAQPYPARPGALGDALRAAGRIAACAGNADLKGQPRRLIAMIAMDSRGIVPLGLVGAELLRAAPESAAGIRTDFARLSQAAGGLLERGDFIALDLGDTGRLAALADWLGDDAYRDERRAALEAADAFVGRLARALAGQKARIMIVVPSGVQRAAGLRDALTPVALWGKGVQPGLLVSPTTRTPGLIANMDIAPTVLEFLGVAIPPEMMGRPARTTPRDEFNKIRDVERFAQTQAVIEQMRVPAMRGLAGFMAVAVGLALALALLGERRPAWLSWLARLMILVPMAFVPAAMLAANPAPRAIFDYVVIAGIITAVFWVLAALSIGTAQRWHWAAFLWGLAAALCVLDVALGGPWVRYSVFTYSVSQGARYYGLGNEAAGLALAGSIGFAARLVELRPSGFTRVAALLALLAVCAVILWPGLGANFGMGLAAAVGLAAATWLMWPPDSRKRVLVSVATLAVLAVLLAIVWDLARGGAAESHVGRAFHGGFANLVAVGARKMVRNWILLQHSPWTWTLSVCGIALFILYLVRPGRVNQILGETSGLAVVAAGCAAGAAAALAFNDSGVIPAAFCLFFAAACVLLEALSGERGASQSVLK